MPRVTRLQAATGKIVEALGQEPRVFTRPQLALWLRENRGRWALPVSLGLDAFLEHLELVGPMRRVELTSDEYPSMTRYLWNSPSAYLVALSMRPEAYLCHGTALEVHGLTDEQRKVIYVNREQSEKPAPSGHLTQAAVDRAFANRQRMSRYAFYYDIYRIVLLSGKQTGRLGVESAPMPGTGEEGDVTSLERTLIDIAVRPTYAGGVSEVLEAFQRARARVSVPTLVGTLKKLGYVYPYHQVIGFYMERAGYEPEHLERLRELGLNIDFYLAYGMKERVYNPDWRLHVPEGL